MAIESLLNDGFNTFLEVGPHPVLATSIQDCVRVAGKECRLVHTLRRNQPELSNVKRAVLSLIAIGCQIDWSAVCPDGKYTSLPNYPWQRELLWVENDRAMQDRIAPITHPMLGLQEAPGAPVYRNDFDHEPMLYLRDHVVSGMPILPAAGYIESLLELAQLQFENAGAVSVRDLQILAPMMITSERGLDCVTSYEPKFQLATIRSLENGRLGAGQVHVTAKLAQVPSHNTKVVDLQQLQRDIDNSIDVTAFYDGLRRTGLEYGPAFQTVRQIAKDSSSSQVLAQIEASESALWNEQLYVLHPTVLDACFQALMPLLHHNDTTFLPTGFEELCVYCQHLPSHIWMHARLESQNARQIRCGLSLYDQQGQLIATLRGMQLTAAAKRERVDQFGDKVKRQILNYEWSYGETLSEPKRLGHWLVVGDESKTAQLAMDGIERYGATVAGIIALASQYKRDGRRYTVRPESHSDVQTVLAEVGELDGVLFVQGLDSTAASEDPTGEQAIAHLITLTQGLLSQSSDRIPRVYVVTSCAHSTGDADKHIEPAQAALNGFARVAYNELEGLRFSTIDLPRRVDQRIADNLVLELICDAEHDEVALRGGLRLHSELRESDQLSTDVVCEEPIDAHHPIAVRPLRSDVESIGTARVVQTPYRPLLEDEIRLAIESMLVPTDVLVEQSHNSIKQPVVEILARVLEIGSKVTDLAVETRVCGFAPADIGSQFVGRRDQFHLVAVNSEADASKLLCALSNESRARAAAASVIDAGARNALVQASGLGLAVARRLEQHGTRVVLFGDNANLNEAHKFTIVPPTPEGVAMAVAQFAPGGFDVIATSCQSHQSALGWHMLADGGTIVDLDSFAHDLCLPARAATLVRADFTSLLQRPRLFDTAVQGAVADILQSEVESAPALSVSISDLAWQKLPLSDANINLVLSFDSGSSPLPVVQSDEFCFLSDATYLITGGFGGFGRKTAEWLVAHGARHLVLTGRTGADNADRQAFVSQLESQGVSVLPAACDTADARRLKTLLDQVTETMPPLKGVFHSGAVIQDEPIAEMSLDTFRTVMRSKALGAWNLHQLTQSLQLDHFVLYSSLANLVGNSRQSAYSAANGFLNGLAHMRAKQGLAGTSVNWGAIADVGVVAQDEKLEQFLRYTGLRGIGSEEGLELLRVGLKRRLEQFGVTVITSWADWARFETRGSKSPRFASLIKADSVGQDDSMRQALLEELSKLDPADQIELLAGLIVEIVAHVLKSSAEDIPIDRAINQLGVDSLMATEIQMTLDSQLGLQISILELIGDSTIRALAAKSLKNLLDASALA